MTNPDTMRLAKMALRDAKARWGAGWGHLSHEQRQGAVALAAAHIMLGWLHHENTPGVLLQQYALKLLEKTDD